MSKAATRGAMELLRTTERSRTSVVLLAAAATALLVFLPTYDQFILPKIVWVKVLTELLAVLTLIGLVAGSDFRIRFHPLNLALFLFVLWKAASWFWAESRSLAADEVRWWALLFLWCLLFQDWLIGAPGRSRLMLCAGALTLSALALSLWILIQDFGLVFYESWVRRLMHLPAAVRDPVRGLLDLLVGARMAVPKLPDWRGWLWAGMGNTNHIADYLALLFPMIVMQYLLAVRKWHALLTLTPLVAAAAALIACYSVGSNGGLILAGLAMALLLVAYEKWEFWRERAWRLGAMVALFGAITAFYVLPLPPNPHPGGIFAQAFASERWREGWPTRVAIWLTSCEMVRQHPLVGIGAGNFTYGYTATLSPRVLNDPDLRMYAGSYTNAAHNEPLQAWVETGVIGLLLLLSLWAVFIHTVTKGLGAETSDSERRLRTGLLAMMIAFIAHSLMNFTLQLPTSSLMFVGLIAVAATFRRHRDEYPLTVRLSYPGFEVSLATSGMRRIESVGLRLTLPLAGRTILGLAAVLIGLWAIAHSIRPLVADIYFNNAKIAVRWGKSSPDAEDFARRALALNPNHHTARKLLSRVSLATGRYAEARAALEKVCERETVYDFYKELGQACWQLGDREAAGRYWAIYFGRCPQMREDDADSFAIFSKEFPQAAAALPTMSRDEK